MNDAPYDVENITRVAIPEIKKIKKRIIDLLDWRIFLSINNYKGITEVADSDILALSIYNGEVKKRQVTTANPNAFMVFLPLEKYLAAF